MNKRYNNYHKHDHKGNVRSLDVVVKLEDYCKRAKELGHTTIFTTNHGMQGDIFEAITLAKQYDLKLIMGYEGYYVHNRYEQDRSNRHIVLIALNNEGAKELNKIISIANDDGFYYKPRIDHELLMNINPNNFIVTTACVAGILKDEELIKELKNKFKDNFFLEVQNHNENIQKEYNKLALEYSKKYNIKIIHGNDSHYIYPQDSKYRDLFLKAKGIIYENESNFILDYPDYDTIVERYKKQGILNDEEISQAINNTLIFDNTEELTFINKEIKLPSIVDNPNKFLKETLANSWITKSKTIDNNKINKYIDAIRYETKIVEDTHMEDYFILDYEIAKLAQSKYNTKLTNTGRGCFTKDAIVVTKDRLKPLNEVKIGDYVITSDGKWNKVLNTFKYDIQENMIEFKYDIQGSSYKKYKNICTLDHKILVNRNNNIIYVEAKNLKIGDLLCSPKIKNKINENKYIDLNKYNTKYKFDDNYIYEEFPTNIKYKYSPRWFQKNNIVNKTFADKIYRGYNPTSLKGKYLLQKMIDNTPFKNVDDYRNYIEKHKYIRRKIPRYIKNDYLWNLFVAMMYGDGWTEKNYGLGFAINKTSKYIYNKYVFCKIAERLDLNVIYNKSKNKNLIQLYINSHTLNTYFKNEFFNSVKGKDKIFNKNLLNQNIINLKALYLGLLRTDGSIDEKSNKICYDSTSLSLINAFKILNNILGYQPLSLDVRLAYKDNRGYNNKESFKVRRSINMKKKIILSDDNYWFLPINEINYLSNIKTSVYDLEIENNHSYMINNIIVHNSAPSFYINNLLGLTNIDRLESPIKLFPTRFMSVERILGARSLPDIDLNTSNAEGFIQATKDLLGEDKCAWMIAWKPLQEASAFRLYCKSLDMSISEYDDVAKNLDDYREDDKWKQIIEESKHFIGVIESISESPCSMLLGINNVAENVGLIKVKNKMLCLLDGYNCDKYKYLKNDYLTVSVWGIIKEVCEMANINIPTIKELNNLLDDKTWAIYEKGLTCTINQADSDFATDLIKRYKPKNISELSQFVAMIRPGCASLLNDFIDRKPYTTGVKELDDLLEDSEHRMIYQESIMKYLIWLGVKETQSYDIIKKIAKKKFKEKELKELKEQLIKGWINNVGSEKGFEETWKVVQDASKYSFNASHSISYAYDSAYGAYLKSHYPLEYYSVTLNYYVGDETRTNKLIKELEIFNIKIKNPQFSYSKGGYFCDKQTNTIFKGIGSIKGLGIKDGEQLYELSQQKNYDNFLDLYIDIKSKTEVNDGKVKILIKLNFFKQFGNMNYLLNIVDIYNNFYKIKTIKKDKIQSLNLTEELVKQYSQKETAKQFSQIDNIGIINYLISNLDNKKSTPLKDILKNELDYLGYIDTKLPLLKEPLYFVLEVKEFKNKKSSTYYPLFYNIKTGEEVKYKVDDYTIYLDNPFKEGDIVQIKQESKKNKRRLDKETGKWITLKNEFNNILKWWNVY